ncbi:MAG: hypothetical protein DHS20C11_23650 [Lysobacteraceae bacterium]|nr:MAG: hypothetical protein DHS20C11_23650 [Xanthomonadaceae bacterium]
MGNHSTVACIAVAIACLALWQPVRAQSCTETVGGTGGFPSAGIIVKYVDFAFPAGTMTTIACHARSGSNAFCNDFDTALGNAGDGDRVRIGATQSGPMPYCNFDCGIGDRTALSQTLCSATINGQDGLPVELMNFDVEG